MDIRKSLPMALIALALWSPVSALPRAEIDQETANRPDEPLRAGFSLAAAIRVLDQEALSWGKEKKCLSCHAGYPLLMARSMASTGEGAERTVLEAAEDLALHPRESRFVSAEAVMVASVLAQYDARTSGSLRPATRFALDRIWELQREDGGWDWIHSGKPPSEIDDDYGVTTAAIGVGAAPEGYSETPSARNGLERIRKYLHDHPPANLHNRAMRLMASLRVEGIMDEDGRGKVVEELLGSQQPDGGWGLAGLGRNWKRADGSEQDYHTSDGYGTGFVIYVLRSAGVSAEDSRIQSGISWLKRNQRASGRWFTRSMEKDGKHYVTYPGTAYAVMALLSCGETPGK